MAIIQCPECGKEISDTVTKCVHCGYLLNKEDTTVKNEVLPGDDVSHTSAGPVVIPQGQVVAIPVKKSKAPLIGVLVGAAVLVAVVVVVVLFLIIGNKKTEEYEQAIKLQQRGKYEDAIELFDKLGNYKDAKASSAYCEAILLMSEGDYRGAYDKLIEFPESESCLKALRNVYYETRLFEAVSELAKRMKNPDSISINEVSFRYSTEEGGTSIEEPACVIMSSGQNGWGGYTSDYSLVTYNEEKKQYEYVGFVDSLDEDSYDPNDDEELYDWLVCMAINSHLKNPEVKDAVDMGRVEALVANKKYKQIARIKELTLKDFSGTAIKVDVTGTEED